MAGISQSTVDEQSVSAVQQAPSLRRGGGGVRDSSAQWSRQQTEIARAVLADPDILLYYAYLQSNQASALADQAADQLSKMLPAVEGWMYAEPERFEPTRLLSAIDRAARQDRLGSQMQDHLVSELTAHLAGQVAPAAVTGSRIQPKGSAAQSQYTSRKGQFLETWATLLRTLDWLRRRTLADWDLVREFAADGTLTALKDAVQADYDSAEDELVAVATAGATVSAMNRTADIRYRFTASLYPSLTATETTTTLDFGQDAVLFGVKTGDVVRDSLRAEASVVSISGSTITFTPALSSGFSVESLLYGPWETMKTGVETIGLASASDIELELSKRERGTAADVRELIEYLGGLLGSLRELTSDELSVVQRVGADEPSGDRLLDVLDAFAPRVPAVTERAGDSLLSGLRSKGFDYAVDSLLRRDVDRVLDLEVDRASYVGRIAKSSEQIHGYTKGLP